MMKCFRSVLSSMVATSHVQLLSTWNVASATDELHFKFYWILINSNSNNHVGIVATVWNSAALEQTWNLFNTLRFCSYALKANKYIDFFFFQSETVAPNACSPKLNKNIFIMWFLIKRGFSGIQSSLYGSIDDTNKMWLLPKQKEMFYKYIFTHLDIRYNILAPCL